MADTEIQEQNVATGAEADLVDTKNLEEVALVTENDQNPSEIPQPLDGDETSTLKNDVHLTNGDGEVNGHGMNGDVGVVAHSEEKTRKVKILSPKTEGENAKKRKSWLLSDSEALEIDEAGTPEEQATFLRELETFHKENSLEFKAPKFYGLPLNTLKLWRAVVKLGGYDVVTTNKLWRQVGESFHPPKTCTTVSYTFRNFYEKALWEYEKYLTKNGELNLPVKNLPGSTLILSSNSEKEGSSHQGSGSGRVRRDSAVRAMQGWHAQRLAGSEEFAVPSSSVKDKGLNSTPKHKKLKSIGPEKHKKQTSVDLPVEAAKQSVAEIVDDGPLADWVKINVKETEDSFEIYALVPGLLRDEVRVQSDPVGKVIITGEPEQLDNPWGITPFKKVVGLATRINPLQTSAVMSMHGRLFVRAPFEK